MDPRFAFLGPVLFTAAILFLIAAAVKALRVSKRVSEGVKATGIVVALEAPKDSLFLAGSSHYGQTITRLAPVVEFKNAEGRTVRFQSNLASSPPRYRVGEEVPVIHPPGRESEAMISGATEVWILPAAFGCLGLMLLVFAAAFLILA